MIGSNGAGKSTTLRRSPACSAAQGRSSSRARTINGIPGHEVVKIGICQSPEGRKIFQRMTVSENLDLGAFTRKDTAKIAEDRERVLELFPRLRERITQKAGTMSGGEQQMLAVARALLGNPTLLLLDEPSMGLAPVLVDLIFETIEPIREQGMAVLLVEQNALAALRDRRLRLRARIRSARHARCRRGTARRPVGRGRLPRRPLGFEDVTVQARSITPLAKANLRERVLRALRAAIISGELTPGEVYSARRWLQHSAFPRPRYARPCSTSPRRT